MTAASYADSKRLSHRAVSPMIYMFSLYLSALSQSIGGFCLAIMAVLDSVGTPKDLAARTFNRFNSLPENQLVRDPIVTDGEATEFISPSPTQTRGTQRRE